MKIALIAHDGKKPEMVAFVMNHKEDLMGAELFATGTTGSHIADTGLTVKRFLSGPLGGDAQIAAMAAENELDMVIFFRTPSISIPTNPMSRCCLEFAMFTISRWQQILPPDIFS